MSMTAAFNETPGGSFRSSSRVLQLALAGLGGGVAGYFLSRLVDNDGAATESQIRHHSGIWFLAVMLGIGAAVIIGNARIDRQPLTSRSATSAAPVLLIGGYLSGYIAQALYSAMLDKSAIVACLDGPASDLQTCYASAVRPARMLGWALAGALGGAGVGASFRSAKRVQNGVLGGAIGGLLGGFAFDLVPTIFSTESADASQFVALCLIGAAMGAFIGLIDTARTSMWLEVITGELRGRQLPVMEDVTTIGSARTAQLRIIGDTQIAEIHARIHRVGSAGSFECVTPAPVLLNGASATSGTVSHGDVLQIGNTQLRVGFRKGSATQGTPVAQLPVAAPTTGQPRSRPSVTVANSGSMSDAPPHAAPPPLAGTGVSGTTGTTDPPEAPKQRPRLPIKPA